MQESADSVNVPVRLRVVFKGTQVSLAACHTLLGSLQKQLGPVGAQNSFAISCQPGPPFHARALQGSSTNLHESIRCGTTFLAWRERLEQKLGATNPVHLRWAAQQHGTHRSGSGDATWVDLETQRDFDTLTRHYIASLASTHRATSSGKTLRVLVIADEGCCSSRSAAPTSQGAEASCSLSTAAAVAAKEQHTPSRRPPQHPSMKAFRCPPAALQPSRKMRRRRMSAE